MFPAQLRRGRLLRSRSQASRRCSAADGIEVGAVVQIAEAERVFRRRKEIDAIEPLGFGLLLRDGGTLEQGGRDGAACGATGARADLIRIGCAYVGVGGEVLASGEQALEQRNLWSADCGQLRVACGIGECDRAGLSATIEARELRCAEAVEFIPPDGTAEGEAHLVLVVTGLGVGGVGLALT